MIVKLKGWPLGGGFAGSLLIIKPSTQGFNYWAAVGLVAALSAALPSFITVKIHPTTSSFEVTFASAVLTAAVAFLITIGHGWEPVKVQHGLCCLR
jgi:hypothetical protein